MKYIKAVGMVGFKKSGKTYLITQILKELKKRKIKGISVIKHSNGKMELDESLDTARLFRDSKEVIGIFKDGSLSLGRQIKDYTTLINNLNCDILLVEGFKGFKNLPKIICINNPKEIKELSNGIELGVFSLRNFPKRTWGIEDIGKIVDLILRKGFLLPNLDCGKCGFNNCLGMAKGILDQKQDLYGCQYITKKALITVRINDQVMELNPFVANILKNILEGFLKSLKGVNKGIVNIKFKL